MIYFCCDERRRNAVSQHPTLNGIDFIEVLDQDRPPLAPRQQTLLVRLLKTVPATLDEGNVVIVAIHRDFQGGPYRRENTPAEAARKGVYA